MTPHETDLAGAIQRGHFEAETIIYLRFELSLRNLIWADHKRFRNSCLDWKETCFQIVVPDYRKREAALFHVRPNPTGFRVQTEGDKLNNVRWARPVEEVL